MQHHKRNNSSEYATSNCGNWRNRGQRLARLMASERPPIDPHQIQQTSNFQRAYTASTFLWGDPLTMNQIPVPTLSPPTSASYVPTVVPNLRQLDGTGLTVALPLSTQPQPMVSMTAAPLRAPVPTGVAVNLGTAAIPTAQLPTVIFFGSTISPSI